MAAASSIFGPFWTKAGLQFTSACLPVSYTPPDWDHPGERWSGTGRSLVFFPFLHLPAFSPVILSFFLCYSLISGMMKLNQPPAFFSPPPPKTNGPYSHDAWPIATANLHAYGFSREVLHVDSVGYNVVSTDKSKGSKGILCIFYYSAAEKSLLKCLFSFFCDG